jgi:hypothetical protein
LNHHPDPEVERLREEVKKLGRVITEVMGAEFDTIMNRQSEDQQASMRWMTTCVALNLATIQLLSERGLLDQSEITERVREIRRRLLARAESIGGDAEVADLFGDVAGEESSAP